MSRIVLDQQTLDKLRQPGVPLEICDEAGRLIGYFSPAADRSLYEGVEILISEEELDRRERLGGGRSLAEILADLERRG